MKPRKLSLPDIALIAGTRGMLGAGIGLLFAGKLNKQQRRAVGLTLLTVGVVTTVPLVINVFSSDDEVVP
jgi:EamA domain-containing membrane protein RarD